MIFLNSISLLQMDRLQLMVCVSTTPQVTCFRGAKVCTKLLQGKVTIKMKLGPKVENYELVMNEC